MAGVDLTAIRIALANAVNVVSGVRAYPTQPGPIATSSSTETMVVVMPDEDTYVNYWEAFKGGAAEVRLRLVIICQMADFAAAQRRVDALMSAGTGTTRSLLDAVQTDRTLSGTVGDTHVGDGRYDGERDGFLTASMSVRCVMRREA